MEAFEAMGRCIGRETVVIAKALQRSTSLVAKWKEPTTDYGESGALSPLDRLETVIDASLRRGKVLRSDSLAPVQYLAVRFGMCLVDLPPAHPHLQDLSRQVTRLCKEFGDLLTEIGTALEDGQITPDERRRIEAEGQELMSAVGGVLALVAEKGQ